MTVYLALRLTAKQEVHLKCLNRSLQRMLGHSLSPVDGEIVGTLNSLPDSVGCAPSVYTFKSLINGCGFTAFLEIFKFSF